MKRVLVLGLAVPTAFLLAAACGELFEEPQQCAFDRDCERFGEAKCDVSRRVCIAAPGSGADASDLSDAGAAGNDSGGLPPVPPTPPSCDVPVKLTADVPGTVVGNNLEMTASTTLDCSKDWILKGRLVVKSGATLTIQPGTKVLMDKASNPGIVVQPGAKIIARGTAMKPVVFTSGEDTPAAGDWRGIWILGAAPPANGVLAQNDPILNYGGNTADDESGALEYVRIEYSNAGLVVAGAGSKTFVDFVQVRRSTDNCYVFQGGTVNVKHLVCQRPGDEMFEFAGGYVGKAQFLFGQRTANGAGHHGLLVDDAFPTIYNATLCGDQVARPGYGVVFRNNARLDVNNLIVSGWNTGLDAVGTLGTPLVVRNSIVADNATNPAYVEDPAEADQNAATFDDDNGFDEIAFITDAGANRTTTAGLVACYDVAAPKPYPNTALDGARTPPNDGFFDATANFIGAVKDPNDAWIRGIWMVFD